MKFSRLKHPLLETGRTLTEIVGVLAIVGVLLIGGSMLYQYAMDKNRANSIINEARMYYTLAKGQLKNKSGWQQMSDFQSELGKTYSYMLDKVDLTFVKVDSVEKGPCERLLDMASKQVLFLTEENTELTTCIDDTIVVVSFDGVEIAECNDKSDCPGAEKAYCNASKCGICKGVYEANAEGTGCQCSDGRITNENGTCQCLQGREVTCSDDAGNTWCCGGYTVCGKAPGKDECVETDGLCSYIITTTDLTQPAQYQADCWYNVAETDLTQPAQYQADCWYNIPLQTTFDMIAYTTKGEMTESKGCSGDEYCAIFWPSQTWNMNETPVLSSNATGLVYGKCQPLTTFSSAGVETVGGEGSKGLVTESKGCSGDEYCAIFWPSQTWNMNETPVLSSNATGQVYGKCQPLTTFSSAGVETVGGEGSKGLMREKVGCPATEYCLLKWKNMTCSAFEDSEIGQIDGICVPITTNTSDCPY